MQLNNLIVVGDSFCANPTGWPQQLATLLNLKLISFGQGGQPWWKVKKFLDSLPSADVDQAEYLVFVHTNADRIPTSDRRLGLIDHSKEATTELEKAIQLYFKYIHDPSFSVWAQQQWFAEINQRWGNKKICHLHSFPWSINHSKILSGLNVTTNLCSISLNELGLDKFELYGDDRLNHLNKHNNQTLANQLFELLTDYKQQKVNLNTDLFDLKTTRWFNWH